MYIIDGHNLIPKVPGLSLGDIDDEQALIELLQTYSRVRRRQLVVYFDDAPPGQAGERVVGTVRAHFVPSRMEADQAIRRRLAAAGRGAKNLTVVSSDRGVQAEARAAGAKVVPSEVFAGELLAAEEAARKAPGLAALAGDRVSPEEVKRWLKLFEDAPGQPARPDDPPATGLGQRKRGGRAQRPRHGFPPREKR
jgi:predicted RNA-binding protein with PIN domain